MNALRFSSWGAAHGCAALLIMLAGAAQEASPADVLAALQETLADAIEASEASVVSIARVRRDDDAGAFRPDPRADVFPRGLLSRAEPQPTDPDFIPNEFAAGVVIDARGLILTNFHVLGEESDYYVTTAGRKVYAAEVIAADPRSDLAVLRVAADDLAPIVLGDAGTLRKGHIVVALGNPYAIARDGEVSASWGIVANLSRKAAPLALDAESAMSSKPTLHHFGGLIQTDAKLNLGASGGALLNLKGEMIGLTTSLAAVSGVEQAAGYAIPVDETFRRVVDRLKQGREVEYGFLGVAPTNLPRNELRPAGGGSLIFDVYPGTPAQRAGLRPDDIVTQVDDQPVNDADDLMLAVGRLDAGTSVRLMIRRTGREIDVPVRLAKYQVRGRKIVTAPSPTWRGMQVDYPTAVMDGPLLREFGGLLNQGCVVVTAVDQESAAWQAGFRTRDLISHVGAKRVETPDEFFHELEQAAGEVDLRVIEARGASAMRTVAAD